MRRHPAAIFAAHALDPARRELYVEGSLDVRFFNWAAGEQRDPNCLVVPIESAAIDVPSGGNRARVIALAREALAATGSIRCFVDSDPWRASGEALPSNVWVTDGSDLEMYVLCEECIEKVLFLAAGAPSLDPARVLKTAFEAGREVAAIRVCSERQALDLPFQSTNLVKHVGIAGDQVSLERDAYLAALLQNSGVSLSAFERIADEVDAVKREYETVSDREFVLGKDAFSLVGEVLLSTGISRDDGGKVLWASFERGLVARHPNLAAALEFLTGG
jgi:hypothetical protein